MTEQTQGSGVRSSRNVILLLLIAGVLRIVGALISTREPFGDAYCYIEQASLMRAKMVARTFTVADFCGFWLPLYQFVCALITLVINQPLYVTRFVSVVAGIGVCFLVYRCSYLLTSNERVSLLVALALALSPFHLQYSSGAMTDVTHALIVMTCMYFVLTERWTLAACFGLAAGLTRLDSWLLIALVPTIQLLRTRRVPVLSVLILACAPAFWLFVCWKATGDPLSSFHAHDVYVLQRLTAHPEYRHLHLLRMVIDTYRLLYSVNIAVLAGCFAGLWLLLRKVRTRATLNELLRIPNPLVCLLFFFAYLGFLVLAYVTLNQSDIWTRYGLVFFSLGLPGLAYSAQHFLRRPSVSAKVVIGILLVVGVVQFVIQGEDLARFWSQTARSQTIASYLKKEYASDRSIKVFCDHPEIRVLSGIPREQFLDSFGDAPKDREGFIGFLRAKGVKFLVIGEESETSTPSQLFPSLITETGGALEGVIPVPDKRRVDSLYRVRVEPTPPPK